MSSALLNTKLYIPRARPDLVLRSRLTEQLQAGAWHPFTLISAPAGFGKTTLVSDWVRSNEWPNVWISLDEGDNDPSGFLSYLLTALQGISTDIGKTTLGALQASQSPPVEAILTDLLNDIANISYDFILVLDDYHLITAQPIHDAVSFLLRHLPPQMHLVISTRADPPLALPGLRARGQMTELRAADLRFTQEEAVIFLNDLLGPALSDEDVAALESRTEGWIAGLQLAAISMHGRDDKRDFIEAFTGSQRHILDYLTDEVFRQQSTRIQTFLLQTSILSRLTGPLCDAVTGRNDGQPTLEQLEAANLFVVLMDEERRWYRYHNLFGTVLQHYLERGSADQDVSLLHQRASDWYAHNGLPDEALEHALSATDFNRAADLVELHARPLLKRGQVRMLLRWLQTLPSDIIHSRPQLSLFYARALIVNLQFGDIEPYLREAESALQSSPDSDISEELNAVRASLTRVRGDAPRAIQLHHQVADRVSPDNLDVRGFNALHLGWAYVMIDDLTAANKAFSEARALNQANGDILRTLYAICNLAEVQVSEGGLSQAAQTYQQGLHVATEWAQHGEPIPLAVGMVYGGLAQLYREWNDLNTATEYALKAIELGELGGPTDNLLQGYISLSRIKQAQGDMAGALGELEEMEPLILRSQTPQRTAAVAAYRARLWLAQSRVEGSEQALQAVAHWLESSDLYRDWRQQRPTFFLPSHPRDFEHLTLVRVLVALGKLDEALQLLGWLLQAAEAVARTRSVIEILMLQALTLDALGEADPAIDALTSALNLAEPEGYIRMFADEGPPIAGLLRQAGSHGIAQTYVGNLMIALGIVSETPQRIPPGPATRMPEPVSDRELEVLSLIATGLSDRQAAARLVVSISTIKKHLQNLYGKLGVHNRTLAIARATELQLL